MKLTRLLINAAVIVPAASFAAADFQDAAKLEDLEEVVAEEAMDEYFLGHGRSLWTTSTTSEDCELCLASGKEHCWRKRLDYSGYWT